MLTLFVVLSRKRTGSNLRNPPFSSRKLRAQWWSLLNSIDILTCHPQISKRRQGTLIRGHNWRRSRRVWRFLFYGSELSWVELSWVELSWVEFKRNDTKVEDNIRPKSGISIPILKVVEHGSLFQNIARCIQNDDHTANSVCFRFFFPEHWSDVHNEDVWNRENWSNLIEDWRVYNITIIWYRDKLSVFISTQHATDRSHGPLVCGI